MTEAAVLSPHKRLPDWEERLFLYLQAAAERPHVYGSHDCILHCAAAVEAQTGVDLGVGHRGKYRSAVGAARYLRKLGHPDYSSLIGAMLPERPVAFARRGDVVLGPDGVPGIVASSDAAAFVGMRGDDRGLVPIPRALWQRAWAVGEA